MNLKYLNFSHIEGFNNLSDEKKDEFIDLYKMYVLNAPPYQRGKLSESKITSLEVTSMYNYRVFFSEQFNILLKPEKKKSTKSQTKKGNIPTIQMRMSVQMHQKVKNLARKENRNMREIIDTACEFYITNRYQAK